MIGGSMSGLLFQMMVVQPLFSKYSNKKLGIMGYRVTTEGLDELSRLFEEGKTAPVIEKIFSLEQTADAFRYFESGDFKGKIIIRIRN
jgi:NADPH:quinone reductase-like Zn-dependent oxidoreductase